MANTVLNFTELDRKTADELIAKAKSIVQASDEKRDIRVAKDEESMRIWRKNLWSEKDEAFFEQLGIEPYQIQYHRPLFNSLIQAQHRNRFKFSVVPTDVSSYRRYKTGREDFINDKIASGEFRTETEAGQYYDAFGDDKYAKMITAYLQHVRNETKAKYKEDDCFENGIITGADFLKVIYSDKYNREGGIDISRVPQRAMFWDENNVEYDLSDVEFIGEVHVLYKDDIVKMYPSKKEEIEEHFKQYTNKSYRRQPSSNGGYRDYYDFDASQPDTLKARVIELWTKEIEDRFIVVDTQTGSRRMTEYGMTEDSVFDMLLNVLLDEVQEYAEKTGDYTRFDNPEKLKADLAQEALLRFEIEQTSDTIWYKTVFTHDVLFERVRSPFPHGQHPYTPYFPQYTQGYFTGVMDDVKDLIIGLNKAYAFRELLLAHSSKGLLVVDQDMLAASGYNLDDIADAYTRIGGVIALKVKANKRLDQAFYSNDTMRQGLNEITLMINDYEVKLQHVIGVNRAMLGTLPGETTSGNARLQLSQGEGNNSIVFDNFSRSLHLFYEKVIMMVAELIKRNPTQVIRALGDQYNTWIEYEIDDDFDLFVDGVRSGLFSLTLIPDEEDPQVKHSREAQYMQLAMAGGMPVEVALEYSSDPNRYDIIKKIREYNEKKMTEMALNQVSIQTVGQLMAQMGISPDAADELVNKLRIEQYKTMMAQSKQNPNAMGMGEIQRAAKEPMRQDVIQNSQA